MSKDEKRVFTTIAVDVETRKTLSKLADKGESVNDAIRRLIQSQVDVYVDFVLVDNELPQLHTVAFQLGEDKHSVYYYDGENIQPTTLAQVQKMAKQPKPNMIITRGDADMMLNNIAFVDDDAKIVKKRLIEFLEQTTK